MKKLSLLLALLLLLACKQKQEVVSIEPPAFSYEQLLRAAQNMQAHSLQTQKGYDFQIGNTTYDLRKADSTQVSVPDLEFINDPPQPMVYTYKKVAIEKEGSLYRVRTYRCFFENPRDSTIKRGCHDLAEGIVPLTWQETVNLLRPEFEAIISQAPK